MKYCMIQLVDISIILTPLTISTNGHSNCFAIPFAKSDSYFFMPSTIKLWNLLPDPLTDLENFNQCIINTYLHLFSQDCLYRKFIIIIIFVVQLQHCKKSVHMKSVTMKCLSCHYMLFMQQPMMMKQLWNSQFKQQLCRINIAQLHWKACF